jgi:hypothetical protein
MTEKPISFNEIKCPSCGKRGMIEMPDRDSDYYEDIPAECTNCGRQHPIRRIPLGEVFSDMPVDPEFDMF